MRRKTLLVVAFLLVLYIGPMIFISSYGGVATPAQPNTVKDFAPAVEYETSTQSITSFSETLPDDVLFYPDSFYDGTIELADYGEDEDENYDPNYVKTQALDNDAFEEVGIDIEIWFEKDVGIEGFSYASYLYATSQDDCNIGFWNFDTTSFDNFEEPLPTSYDWMNGTVYDANYWNTTHIGCQLSEVGVGDANFFWDYAELTFFKMTLADENHYAESFADVSDWVLTAGETFGTDNDRMYIDVPDDASYDTIKSNSPSIINALGYYYELRIQQNVSYTAAVVLRWYSQDNLGGTYGQTGNLQSSLTGTTYKGIITSDQAIESLFVLFFMGVAGDPVRIEIDYLRISPANESGWQHDGSTTTGVIGGNGGTASSDGDIIHLIDDGDGSIFKFYIDTTTTQASLSTTYYQFVELKFSQGNSYFRLDSMDALDVSLATVGAYTEQGSTLLYRYNLLAAESAYCKYLQLTSYAGNDLYVDYIKIYSIANYTVTQSGTSIDDILYVDSDVLYCSGTSFTSFVLDHDPALSIETAVAGDMWTMTTSSGTPEIDFYLDAAWLGYSSETSGTFPDGTLTDFRIRFTDNAQVEAVTFLIRVPEWNEVGVAILIFWLPIDPASLWALNNLYILLGAGLVIGSGVYLVKGGRSAVSMDKFYIVVVAFLLGWALIIGGVMP